MTPAFSPSRSIFPFWLIVGAVLFLGACRGTVPISTLLEDPGRYDGKTVRIKGTVHETVGALGRGAYRVNDGPAR